MALYAEPRIRIWLEVSLRCCVIHLVRKLHSLPFPIQARPDQNRDLRDKLDPIINIMHLGATRRTGRTYKCRHEERFDLVSERGDETPRLPTEAKRDQDAVHQEQAYVKEEENEADDGQPSRPKRNWFGRVNL